MPVKEKSDVASLWCGVDYDGAMTGCARACPGETNEECPQGMSCFSGSSCTEEGEAVVREGYRCGKSWEEASEKCAEECQSKNDCKSNEECFAEVVCKSELEEEGLLAGKFCSSSWDITMENCNEHYKEDKDCPVSNQWCYWVECPNGDEEIMMEEPTTEATKPSCNAEVRRCPNEQFVGRAQQLNCDFYPCPEGAVEEDEGVVKVVQERRLTIKLLVTLTTVTTQTSLAGAPPPLPMNVVRTDVATAASAKEIAIPTMTARMASCASRAVRAK